MFKILSSFLCAICFIFSSSPVYAEYVPNQVIISAKKDLSSKKLLGFIPLSSDLDPVLKKYKVKTTTPLFTSTTTHKNTPIASGFKQKEASQKEFNYVLTFDENIDPLKVSKEFESSKDINYAQPNYIYHTPNNIKATLVPNDVFYKQHQESDFSLVNVEKAWDVSRGEASVVIAVIDTGLLWTHEDLSTSIWTNPNETENGKDDDGNGFVDDIRGWDFSENDNDPRDKKMLSSDINGHGTHVSGVIAAKINNNIGISGICGDCSLMGLRAGKDNVFTSATVSNALNYAVIQKVDIINMSFGGELTDKEEDKIIHDKIKLARQHDILLVAASGNDASNITNSSFIPAVYDGVITVSASDDDGEFATSWNGSGGSNYGEQVDIMAPGTSIFSTYVNTEDETNIYASIHGTSFAAPIVSGALGVLKSVFPDKTNTQILTAITSNATDKKTTGKDIYTGHGLLNVYESLKSLDSGPPVITHPILPTQNFEETLTITANIVEDSKMTVTFYYRLKKSDNTYVNTTFQSQVLTSETPLYTYQFSNLSSDITEIEYYFHIIDAFNYSVTFPETAPTIPHFTVFKDLTGPNIEPPTQSHDFHSKTEPILFNLYDNVGLDLDSLRVTINYSAGTVTLPVNIIDGLSAQASATLNKKTHVLTVDISDIPNLKEEESIRIDVAASDINGLTSTFAQTLQLTPFLKAFGPSGENSAIITVPNPFDPTIESTTFWYQLSTNADIHISIYSLDLKLVKTFSRTMSAGPTDEQDIWDGTDASGNKVPNGVYLYIFKATSSSESIIKRGKIAVLRR